MVKKLLLMLFMGQFLLAHSCNSRLFSLSTEGTGEISLHTIISDLSDSCNLNILVKDSIAKERLKQTIKFVKIYNATLDELLKYILGNNGFFYKLENDTLTISFIKTKNFKIDYVNNTISGTTNFSASTTEGDTGSNTLSSQFNFDFWKDFSENIEQILTAQANSYYQNPPPIIDKTSGLVTITGTKEQLERVQNYIDTLNKRLHKEVLIDVKIYSVKLSNNHTTGINWSNFGLAINKNIPIGGNVGQTIVDSTTLDMKGLLNFLSQYGKVSSISNPKITTLNNQKAIITVGQTINYSYNSITKDATGNTLQSENIDSKFVGILLDITPEISDEGDIIMNINPSVSALSPTQLNPGLPPDTIEKKLNTMIRIKDGKTIILGGLITDEDTFVVNGVPILKEIPVVKYLFSSKEKISKREELVFVITPHIIDMNKEISPKKAGFGNLPSLEQF